MLVSDVASTDDPDLQRIRNKVARGEGISTTELAKFLGVVKSTVSVRANSEHFPSWSAEKDPDGRPWEFRGEGRDRVFYRQSTTQ